MLLRGVLRRGERAVDAVRPNLGIEVAYQRRLDSLVEEMYGSFLYWMKAGYRANPPELLLAEDANSATAIRKLFEKLAKHWQKKFDFMAPQMAEHFSKKMADRADGAMKSILSNAGWSVKLAMTPAVEQAHLAAVAENVGLIRNISQQGLTKIEGILMRSVALGQDAGYMAKALQADFGMTRRRAALIARDQNNKVTAVITRTRQIELGMDEAIWVHSTAGRHPRPEHVAFSGKRYNVRKGAFLEGKCTWPGHEINCRCVSKSIIPGF